MTVSSLLSVAFEQASFLRVPAEGVEWRAVKKVLELFLSWFGQAEKGVQRVPGIVKQVKSCASMVTATFRELERRSPFSLYLEEFTQRAKPPKGPLVGLTPIALPRMSPRTDCLRDRFDPGIYRLRA